MPWEWEWLLIASLSAAVILTGYSLYVIFRMRYRLSQWKRHVDRDWMRRRELLDIEAAQGTIETIIRDKKERFSNVGGVSFHFADKEEIKSFYNDTFREPTLESLVSEITGGISTETKGGLPKVLESKIGGHDFSKWVSKLKLPETSLAGMFVKYQQEVIRRGEVTLGLEELDVELKELQEFDTSIENLDKVYDFVVNEEILQNHRTTLREKAAENTLSRLEAAAGWVLIEGKFLIAKNEDLYTCALHHPVNEFLPEEHAPLTISILLPEGAIERRYSGNYAKSVGKVIPLRVFGKVWQPVDRNASVWELQITPLAIY